MIKTLATILSILFLSLPVLAQEYFTEVSDESGLSEIEGFRVWLADVNGDNYPDYLYSGDNGATKNHIYLYLNVPNPDTESSTKRIFLDYTEQSGIQKSRIDSVDSRIADIAALADLDNDGDLDLVTSIYGHRVQNYKNSADRTEVMLNDGNGNFTLLDNNGLNDFNFHSSLDLGLSNTTGLSFLDYDLDGIIDLYVGTWFANYGVGNDIYMGNFLFKGNGDGTFQKGVQVGAAEPLYGTNVTDWNNDGWPDIINSPYCRTSGQFFKNVGGTFVEASSEVGYNAQRLGGDHGQNLCQWEANPSDFDNDGDMDLLEVKVHGGYNDGEGRTTVTVNSGPENGYKYDWELGRLQRSAPTNSHLGDQGGTWLDINNDGWQDVALGQNSYPQANIYGQERLYLLLQDSNGIFNDVSGESVLFNTMKEAHSMEPADYDLDGDLDLFLSRISREQQVVDGQTKNVAVNRIEVLRNDNIESNNFIQIKLDRNSSVNGANASYIGAKVFVYMDEFVQKQEIQSGLGHFAGMQPFIRTFGLGKHNAIDSVVVIYPNKEQTRMTYTGVPVNTFMNIGDEVTYESIQIEGAKLIAAENSGTYNFGNKDINETYSANHTVINLSEIEADITIDEIQIIEGGEFFSVEAENLPTTIAKGESLDIPITFSPKERKWYTGKILLKNNSDNATDLVLNLRGFGFEPKPLILTNESEIQFENVWVDSVNTQEFTVYNTGELPLEISSIELESNTTAFSLSNTGPITVPVGESVDITATFNPEFKDSFSDVININSNAFNGDTASTINIFGVCDGPNSEIATNIGFIIAFGDVAINETKEFEVKIENEGEGELLISDIAIENNTDAAYSLPDDMQTPLRIQDEYSLTISFNPTQEKLYSGDFTIKSDAVNDPNFLKRITGTGVTKTNVDMWENGKKLFDVKLSPNPATNRSLLEFNNLGNSNSKITISLFDVTGKIIKDILSSRSMNSLEDIELDLSDVNSGTYYLQILSDGESRITVPLQIKR